MNRINKKIIVILCAFFVGVPGSLFSEETIKIATWNIEHLGGSGRGFPEIKGTSLPMRTEKQLEDIAVLIRDKLKIDVLAIQEVAVTDVRESELLSQQLETITSKLGPDWHYILGRGKKNIQSLKPAHNLNNAYIWNSKKVRMLDSFSYIFPNEHVGKQRLFDRFPLIGYFQALKEDKPTNDFLLVNVHLASGQENDENHLVALVIIEQNLNFALKKRKIFEKDRIILGDFNDNPYAKNPSGSLKYMDFAYRYMEQKKYTNLVSESTGATRMNTKLNSIIDHILINNEAKKHMKQGSFVKYMPVENPQNNRDALTEWRKTYSDHFPLMFELKVANYDGD